MTHRLFRWCRMLASRGGCPCKCMPSQFLWATRASCVHRMVAGIMRGQVSFIVHFVDAHLSVDSLIAGRVVFSMRMWLHSAFSGCGGAIGYRWWRTPVHRSKSDANPYWQHLRANTGGHIRDLFVGNGMPVRKKHGFADTVRFRGRGLLVDRALSTGHNRVIRGGAVMPFTCCGFS